MTKKFERSIHSAIENPNLTGALGRFSEAYTASLVKAYEGIDFEELRTKISGIKSYAADHLEELAGKFTKAAEARGVKVFLANSPEAVNDYITNLCKEKGVKRIVKSKSMASEEIHLNEHLAKNGIRADETDLGEWIIQLAGQRPSHMVMPAIHLTREEVSDIFSKEVKERLESDIPVLVKIARKELREKFFQATMGISGANIAIAETGTIVIVTNEGNARLVTTLPKIHVAVVGIEKLILSYNDAAPILTVLPKSATNQLMTSYVSIITGPTQNDDGTMKEIHIILMDNRRTDMAKDPKFKKALQCIRCAACLNVCPVYRLVGGHVFGHVYVGGIGTILTAWFNELKASEDIQGLCIQCGRCKEICPGRIDIPGLVLEIRRRLAKKQNLPFIQKAALSVINNRNLFHKILRAAYIAQKPFARDGLIRHLPMFMSELAEHRSLPAIAPVPFRDLFRNIKQPAGKGKAAFFSGCAIEFIYPQIGEAVIKILNKAGIEVIYPEIQSCCGIPHWNNGAFDMLAEAAACNIKALLENDAEYIITACASCATALKKEYANILREEHKSELILEAERLSAKTLLFTELVKKMVDEKRLIPKDDKNPGSFTYHDSCHSKRHSGIFKEPRETMAACGYKLKEMFECDTCCGMGGSYTVKRPELSMRMLKRKVKNIEDTGADVVTMECPGCLMQIAGGLDKSGSKVKVFHIADLLIDRFE